MLSVHFSCSILTRIFPWGVPGPPLLRNRGPVRTFGGQSYSKWSLTWSTYLIQHGEQYVFDSITMHTPIFSTYVGTTKLTTIKLNLDLLITCFLFISTSKMLGCYSTAQRKVDSLDSKLDSRSSKFSRIENWVSRIKFRGSRIEFRGSSFEFRDTRRIYRGSRTEISRKRFNSRKQNNSDEQNNWRAALFAQTRFECMQIFFRVVHFLQGTCGSHIYTEADNSKTANKSSSYAFYLPERVSFFFFARLQPEASVLFWFAWLQPAAKTYNANCEKICFTFSYEIHLTYKNFNLRSIMLSLLAEMIRKCMSIDISFSFNTRNGFTCARQCNANCVFIDK